MVSKMKRFSRKLNKSHESFWDNQIREHNKLVDLSAYAPGSKHMKKRRKGESINVWMARNH